MTDLLSAAREFGPLAVMAIFFLWQGWHREGRMQRRIVALENEQRRVILPLVRECSATIAENTEVMKRIEIVLEARHELELKALEEALKKNAR